MMLRRSASLPCHLDSSHEDVKKQFASEKKDPGPRRPPRRTSRRLASSLQHGNVHRRGSYKETEASGDTVDSLKDETYIDLLKAAEEGVAGVRDEELVAAQDQDPIRRRCWPCRYRKFRPVATRAALFIVLAAVAGIVLGVAIAMRSPSEKALSNTPNDYAYAEHEVVEFNLPASWQPGGWGPKLDIDGYAPAGPGPFPVYVWLTGTGESHWRDDDRAHARDMARRGFVAASVDYPNETYPRRCKEFVLKARDIFLLEEGGVTYEWTAISAVCAQDKADCGRGIAVSGFSQGANLSNLAHNFNNDVRAAYLLGNVESNVNDCWDKGDTTLDRSRILSVMGEDDRNKEEEYEMIAASLESTTGYLRGDGLDCDEGAHDCIQSDGSGWYIVQPTETASGRAGHCFQFEDDACWKGALDANYHPSDNKWGMKRSHEWLVKTTLRRQEDV